MRCLGFPMVMHQDAAELGFIPIPPTVRLSGHGHCAILRVKQRLYVSIPNLGSWVRCQGSEFVASMARAVDWAVSRGGVFRAHSS